jgi:hypothetical protein
MPQEQVSGKIWATTDSTQKEGESYLIRSSSGSGWGLPVRDLNPKDLRALADRIELQREISRKKELLLS